MQSLELITTQSLELTIATPNDLQAATALLSTLNAYNDELQAHKEEKTKPLNQALKKIREDYKPREQQLSEAITLIRQKLTVYATDQEREAKLLEAKILDDKRTTDSTKITRLSTLTPTVDKVSTDQGSITFTTVTKYRLVDHTKLTQTQVTSFMELNTTTLKAYIKANDNQIPPGIEAYEEKSLRNFR